MVTSVGQPALPSPLANSIRPLIEPPLTGAALKCVYSNSILMPPESLGLAQIIAARLPVPPTGQEVTRRLAALRAMVLQVGPTNL